MKSIDSLYRRKLSKKMGKFRFFLVIYIILLLPSLAIQGVAAQTPTITLSDGLQGNGDNIDIMIDASNLDEVGSFQLDFFYDTLMLKAVNVTPGGLISGATFTQNIDIVAGKISLAFISLDGISGSGTVATLSFEADDFSCGENALTFSELEVTDTSNNPIDTSFNDDSFKAICPSVSAVPSVECVNSGDKIDVNIDALNFENVGSFQVDMYYDPLALEVEKITQGSLSSGTTFTSNVDNIKGKITLAFITVIGVNGTGTLATVTFNVKDTGDKLSFDLSNLDLADINNNKLGGILDGAVISGCEKVPATSGASPPGGGGGGGANVATAFISRIGQGQTISTQFNDKLSPYIPEIVITAKKEVYSVGLTIKYPSNKPYGTSDIPEKVFKYIEINPSGALDDEAIDEAIIKFKVEKKWLESNDLDKAIMIRFHDGEWIKLETVLTGEDEIYEYYSAISPGFSYFAIIGEKSVIIPFIPSIPPEVETPETQVEPELETVPIIETEHVSSDEAGDLEQESVAPLPVLSIFLVGCLAAGTGLYYWRYFRK